MMTADTPLTIATRANARMADLIEWLARDPNALGNVTEERLADVFDELARLAKVIGLQVGVQDGGVR